MVTFISTGSVSRSVRFIYVLELKDHKASISGFALRKIAISRLQEQRHFPRFLRHYSQDTVLIVVIVAKL